MSFFRTFWLRMETTPQLAGVLVCQFTVSFLRQNYVINAFRTMTYFS